MHRVFVTILYPLSKISYAIKFAPLSSNLSERIIVEDTNPSVALKYIFLKSLLDILTISSKQDIIES